MIGFRKLLKCAVAATVLCAGTVTAANGNAQANAGKWLLHTSIPVEEGMDVFAFWGGDFDHDGYRDMIAIKKKNTGTNRTEVHVLNGRNRFQNFLMQTGTALENSYGLYDFVVGDYNRDRWLDVYAIKTRSTESKHTEVHVLGGSTGYKGFLAHAVTPLEPSFGTYKFVLGDYNRDGHPDLYAIKLRSTRSGKAELNILDGSKDFREFLLHAGLKLESAYDRFSFALADYNRDGIPDLYAIKKSHTGTKSTEIYVLNGAREYQDFLVQTGTKLEEAGDNFLFDVGDLRQDGENDLYAVKVRNTDSGHSEIHVLGGIGIASGILQKVTYRKPIYPIGEERQGS